MTPAKKKLELKPSSANITLFSFTLSCLLLCSMIQSLQNSLSNMTFSCINCNSLNMSKLGTDRQKIKLYGIASLRSDVIFLSDIRLANNNGVSFAHDLEKIFSVTPYGNYKFLHNSVTNSRGVGLLINCKLNLYFYVHKIRILFFTIILYKEIHCRTRFEFHW